MTTTAAHADQGVFRVRFYWRDIDAVLSDMRTAATAPFKATLDGNFPAIECYDRTDYERLARLFPVRP